MDTDYISHEVMIQSEHVTVCHSIQTGEGGKCWFHTYASLGSLRCLNDFESSHLCSPSLYLFDCFQF